MQAHHREGAKEAKTAKAVRVAVFCVALFALVAPVAHAQIGGRATRPQVVPPQGPDIREYVNEHPFLPRPPNFDTTWWVGHDGTLHLEWRTPRQSSKVYIHGGGKAELRTAGDSLVGQTTVFRDAGQINHLAIALTRLRSCPDGLASDSGAT